jgi:hypothetical protein
VLASMAIPAMPMRGPVVMTAPHFLRKSN